MKNKVKISLLSWEFNEPLYKEYIDPYIAQFILYLYGSIGLVRLVI